MNYVEKSMFLSRRSTQAEYFDAERPRAELREFYACLDQVNRFFGFAEPFQRHLPRMLGPDGCVRLGILDLGAGDGRLGKALTEWAAARGWEWRVTNLDLNLEALSLSGNSSGIGGSVLDLPFKDSSFDVVIASQTTHHLETASVRRHLAEAFRVARRNVIICDLHRNVALYATLWLLFSIRRFPRTFRSDGLLSVKRAWRVSELRTAAWQAGLTKAEVRLYYGARVLLLAAKSHEPPPTSETSAPGP